MARKGNVDGGNEQKQRIETHEEIIKEAKSNNCSSLVGRFPREWWKIAEVEPDSNLGDGMAVMVAELSETDGKSTETGA